MLMKNFRFGLIIAIAFICAILGLIFAGVYYFAIFILFIAVFLISLLAILFLTFRMSLPALKGQIKLKGLQKQVKIIRDKDQVPHIFAETDSDAYWGLGYVHAQDRLWQMEFQRLSGQGRLSEVMGKRVLTIDCFMRTLGFFSCSQKVWDFLPSEDKKKIEAYTSGINAFIENKSALKLGAEFLILRYKPQLWTGVDVVLLSKMLAWSLSSNYITELLRNDLEHSVGKKVMDLLMPHFRTRNDNSSNEEKNLDSEQIVSTSSDKSLSDDEMSGEIGEGIGSNMWAVGSRKSLDESVVIANDPHLISSLPLTWYLSHLHGENLDVIGATVPGIPAVISGRNKNIAWGITNLSPDIQDLFREKIDEENSTFEYEGEQIPLEVSVEEIKIKGEKPFFLEVKKTRNGPVISELIDKTNTELSAAGRLVKDGYLSLKWTGFETNDSTLSGFFNLNLAHDWQSFKEALKLCVSPSLNVVYGDTNGNIGFHAFGKIPVRVERDGGTPADGTNAKSGWSDYIPFQELPNSFNPESEVIVSTNNHPPDPEYAWLLSRDWVEPFRHNRISEVLSEKSKIDFKDHIDLQCEFFSPHAKSVLPLLLDLCETTDPYLSETISMLKKWNCNMNKESVEATIFIAWWQELSRAVLREYLNPELLKLYEGWTSYANRFVVGILKGEIEFSKELSIIAEETLKKSLLGLEKRLGKNFSKWSWGKVHRAVFPHYPFHSILFIRFLFSRSCPRGGDWSSVNFSPYLSSVPFIQRNVPGYRQIIDLSGLDKGIFIQAVGQSGHFLSRHYSDYLAKWQNNDYIPMRFSAEKIKEDESSSLIIDPEN